MFSLFLIYAIGNSGVVLSNTIVKFLSNISMEIYLCHMVIYRGLEKLRLIHIFDSYVLSYLPTSAITLCGAIVFSIVVNKIFKEINTLYKRLLK